VSAGDFLILRRAGVLWALPELSVRTIRRHDPGASVETSDGELLADEVVGWAADLEVRAPGGVLTALWRGRCTGVAVLAGVPVVVLDPAAVPPMLREEGACCHARQ
jgi:hypothetical protein